MVSERAITSTVSGDLQEIRDNFDINNTIPYILENYLVANNTKSPLVIPSYQNS
ncbi:hypothetical protein IJM86_01140 [bacterium]|nr:hypothetical protein [bacterium]